VPKIAGMNRDPGTRGPVAEPVLEHRLPDQRGMVSTRQTQNLVRNISTLWPACLSCVPCMPIVPRVLVMTVPAGFRWRGVILPMALSVIHAMVLRSIGCCTFLVLGCMLVMWRSFHGVLSLRINLRHYATIFCRKYSLSSENSGTSENQLISNENVGKLRMLTLF
jgi:hypothetical protein